LPVTLRDIARNAGVSVVTVFRALDNKPDIDPNTKQRILEIAKQMNYSPNLLAKNLRSRRTRTLGVIIPDNSDLFYAEILQGIGNTVRSHSYQIILSMLSRNGCQVKEELVTFSNGN